MIPETEVFTETVDFQEVGINEPVLGGPSPEGPINRIARILGSRTLWLRAQLAIVQAQGLWFRFTGVITASYILPKADAGGFYSIGGTASGIVITLPDGNSPGLVFKNGQTITFKNNNRNSVTIQRFPGCSDLFDNGELGVAIKQGDTVTLTYDEAFIWYVVYRTRTKDEVGVVKAFAGSGYPQGYLPCNGAAVSRTTYSYLFSIIGIAYGAGDGTTTFNLPDLRGEFIRGLDAGRGVDTGRVLGSSQSDLIKAHTHDTDILTNSFAAAAGADGNPAIDHTTTPSGSFGGAETRPRNVAMNYIIYHGVI